MVEVNITDQGFFISGHAKYDEYGYDIVCSAISALSQSIALALNKYGSGKIYSTQQWLGFESENINDEQMALLDALRMGMQEIEQEFPKHIQVRTKRGVFKR